jgi:hypothetical protein
LIGPFFVWERGSGRHRTAQQPVTASMVFWFGVLYLA